MLLPMRWWLGAFFAASIHELAHLTLIFLTAGQVEGMKIIPFGANITMLPMSRGREALCAAAGPAGSLILCLIGSFWPEAAVCALFQGMFNLIPIYPMDGGRIIRCLLPQSLCTGIEVFFLIFLVGTGVWCSVNLNMGIYSMLPGCLALYRRLPVKIPCKESKLAVQ